MTPNDAAKLATLCTIIGMAAGFIICVVLNGGGDVCCS